MYDFIHVSEEVLLNASIKKGKILMGIDEEEGLTLKEGDFRPGNLFVDNNFGRGCKLFKVDYCSAESNWVFGIYPETNVRKGTATPIKQLMPIAISIKTLSLLGFSKFSKEKGRGKNKLTTYYLQIPKSRTFITVTFGGEGDPDAVSNVAIGAPPEDDKQMLINGLRLRFIHDIQNLVWALSKQELDIITTF